MVKIVGLFLVTIGPRGMKTRCLARRREALSRGISVVLAPRMERKTLQTIAVTGSSYLESNRYSRDLVMRGNSK